MFEATNRQLFVAKVSVVCLIANIVLNLILIPKFSYIGACISTVITEIILVGFILETSYKIGYGISLITVKKNLFKVIIASSTMSVFILYFNYFNIIILIFLSAILYLSVLYAIRGINNDDISLLKKIINK